AAVGHVLFGDFKFGLTSSVLLGSVPGVIIGATLSSRAPDHVIRPTLIVVLLASSLKLLGLSNLLVGGVVLVSSIVGVAYALRTSRDARENLKSA
ncbi:MAG TPA: hypothetical protein VMF89_32045, partial [Polyangiales bacterium]|nr:hypothetical protein [Polyangiales bacterium]